ncbi:MAG: ATP-binding protein [Candidatus Dormibacteraeota bacterium]|nr:ATP-binding protein [Candidatus Dormibacteraeota bacterium]
MFLVFGILALAAVVNTVLNLFGYLVLPVTIGGKLLAAGLFLFLLVLLVVASRSLAREARQVADAAHRVENGDFSARLNEGGWGGLSELARAFNSMSSRLEATESRRRSFLAEVTHELRTPLAIIRGEAEAIADGVHAADPEHLGRILDATRTVERLVEDLGTLSLSDAGGLILKREPVDLEVLVNQSISDLKPAAELAGVAFEAHVSDGIEPVLLDPARIRGVLGNLLANALRHTPRGGRISVAAEADRNGVAITVQDTGSGIPAEMLPHVFERFVKDPASPGSGLGLAIARDVLAAHLGSIETESPPGGGTTVRIWLPSG